MPKFLYDRALNCVKCGYELNRIALILHILTSLERFYISSVAGITCIIFSYTCVYFGELVRVQQNSDYAAPRLALGAMIFTTLAYVLWLLNRLLWR